MGPEGGVSRLCISEGDASSVIAERVPIYKRSSRRAGYSISIVVESNALVVPLHTMARTDADKTDVAIIGAG